MIVTRTFLNKKYNLNRKWWNTAHDRLLEHLSDYMDITEIKEEGSIYKYEIISELPEVIPPLPRKSNMDQKKKDYAEYTKEALGGEYQYNSKAKIAREAIRDFGAERYGHEYYKSIAQRYIAKPFDEYSDKEEDSWAWVWFSTYQPLDLVTLGYWLTLLKEEKIEEEDQADAFRRYADGEDIKTEVRYYKTAIQKFRIRFGDIPIKVARYKRKNERGE